MMRNKLPTGVTIVNGMVHLCQRDSTGDQINGWNLAPKADVQVMGHYATVENFQALADRPDIAGVRLALERIIAAEENTGKTVGDVIRQVKYTETGCVKTPCGEKVWPPEIFHFFDNVSVADHMSPGALRSPAVSEAGRGTGASGTGGGFPARLPQIGISPAPSAAGTLADAACVINAKAATHEGNLRRDNPIVGLLRTDVAVKVIREFRRILAEYDSLTLKESQATRWSDHLTEVNTTLTSHLFSFGDQQVFHLEEMGGCLLTQRCINRVLLSRDSGPVLVSLLKTHLFLLRATEFQNAPTRQKQAYLHLLLEAEVAMEGNTYVHTDTNTGATFENYLETALFVGSHPQLHPPLITREEAALATDARDSVPLAQVPDKPEGQAPPAAKPTPPVNYVKKADVTKAVSQMAKEKDVVELTALVAAQGAAIVELQGKLADSKAKVSDKPPL
jgi:hypothetical protein